MFSNINIIVVFGRLLEAARLKLASGERQRLQWNDGSVCCYLDPEGQCLYALVTSSMSYPERYAFRLLNQLTSDVSQRHGPMLAELPPFALNKSLRSRLAELMDTFENPHILEQQSRSMTAASGTVTNGFSSRNANDINMDQGIQNGTQIIVPKRFGCCSKTVAITVAIFVVLAAVVGVIIYLINNNKKPAENSTTATASSTEPAKIVEWNHSNGFMYDNTFNVPDVYADGVDEFVLATETIENRMKEIQTNDENNFDTINSLKDRLLYI